MVVLVADGYNEVHALLIHRRGIHYVLYPRRVRTLYAECAARAPLTYGGMPTILQRDSEKN